jgi:hypothetical protein
MQNMNAAVAEMASDAERLHSSGRARFWTQMQALFLKNLSFQVLMAPCTSKLSTELTWSHMVL